MLQENRTDTRTTRILALIGTGNLPAAAGQLIVSAARFLRDNSKILISWPPFLRRQSFLVRTWPDLRNGWGSKTMLNQGEVLVVHQLVGAGGLTCRRPGATLIRCSSQNTDYVATRF